MSREAPVLRAILRAFDGDPTVRLWRNTVGTTEEWGETSTGAIEARHITYGLGEGSPDIVGVVTVRGLGVMVGIEAKSATGRVRPAQAQWLAAAAGRGIITGVARSVDEARAIIAAGRARVEGVLRG
jgi:hypothetical protein